ncbi:hypothetical protein PL11_003050 [Lentilactobacillus curieae]|uniref:Uncharacterized protein n=1 Tax=Lentilactobacillus curieae TaxID=1138822 RepID=A0A1S6QH78_9LACO|nr:hypothetical protein [Lentilactobacillus curieae]AQW20964.1 hypothetical protein PL11_003050 [Lentilactobacillus curieae]
MKFQIHRYQPRHATVRTDSKWETFKRWFVIIGWISFIFHVLKWSAPFLFLLLLETLSATLKSFPMFGLGVFMDWQEKDFKDRE